MFSWAPKSLWTVTAVMKLRYFLLGRKAMTNLDSIFKSRDITLATKVHLVKRKKKENEVTQLYPTLCDPMDSSPSGSSIHGIFQARILGWVAISFSRGSSQPRDQMLAACFVDRCFYHLSHQGSQSKLWFFQ